MSIKKGWYDILGWWLTFTFLFDKVFFMIWSCNGNSGILSRPHLNRGEGSVSSGDLYIDSRRVETTTALTISHRSVHSLAKQLC